MAQLPFESSPRKTLQQIDVFVSSPSDVNEERQIALRVIQRLNRLHFISGHYLLRPLAYEDNVPAVVGQSPQTAVDRYMMGAGKSDLFICILWHRMGTPVVHEITGEQFQSGTEYEFLDAYRAYQKFGKPYILLYRGMKPFPPDIDPEQLSRVGDFFKRFVGGDAELKGIYKTYLSYEEFEEILFHDLELVISKNLILLNLNSTNSISTYEPMHHEDWREAQKTQTSKVSNVLYHRNPLFTGREELLELLHEKLATKQPTALTQAQAINGLGGIGKTQVAVEYAYRYEKEYQVVSWVRAATRETIITDFVTLAALLHLPVQNVANPSIVVAVVKEWLTSHPDWLLILDNVDDLGLIHEFLPPENTGHVLLTTRLQATGTVANAIAVDKMSSEEGTLLLLRRAKLLSKVTPLHIISPSDRGRAKFIVEALDGLPLALDQAGAYVEETGCSLSEYLALYQQRRLALLSRRSDSSFDYPETVASTWSLSFQQVEQASPAAADLLRLCAFLDPDAIPEAIVTEGAKELGPVLEPVAVDPYLLNEAILVLRRYSLVKRNPEEKLLNLHRLVQVVLRDGMDEATQQQWAQRAVRAVNAVFPKVTYETWTLAQRYLSQVEVCADLIEHYHLWFPEAARLLHQAGWYLRESAQYVQSEHLLQLSLTIYKQTVGAEHRDVADNLNSLALLYHVQGRFSEAEPLYQEAYVIREKVLGPEHFGTAINLNNMGEFYRAQGRYSEAEPLYKRSLAIREKVLGPDAKETAIVINNLARTSYAQGQYEKAEALYLRVQRIREKTLKPDHPEVAAILDHLARLYYAQGQYDKAEPLMQRAITIRQEVLGSKHHHFAQSLCGLAKIYCAQGRYAEAEPPLQQALAICEIMHGPKHHSTLLMLENLAELYRLQGRSSEAAPLYPRIREIYARLSLSAVIALKEHEPLYQQVLAAYDHVPGPDDPAIATVLETYAARLQQAGRMQEAAIFNTRAQAIRAKSLV